MEFYNKKRENHVKLSIIFKETPETFGFRGDLYFWNYLKDKFSDYEFPFEYNMLEEIIREEHFRLTGINLTENSMGICEAFSFGGMSSGCICGHFWVKTVFPLLKERIKKFNK